MAKPIIIIDLETSLVSNFADKQIWFAQTLGQDDLSEWISQEEYREDLIEIIRECTVVLTLERKQFHVAQTLSKIYDKYQWVPQITVTEHEEDNPSKNAKTALETTLKELGAEAKSRIIAISGRTEARRYYYDAGISVMRWIDTPTAMEVLRKKIKES